MEDKSTSAASLSLSPSLIFPRFQTLTLEPPFSPGSGRRTVPSIPAARAQADDVISFAELSSASPSTRACWDTMVRRNRAVPFRLRPPASPSIRPLPSSPCFPNLPCVLLVSHWCLCTSTPSLFRSVPCSHRAPPSAAAPVVIGARSGVHMVRVAALRPPIERRVDRAL